MFNPGSKCQQSSSDARPHSKERRMEDSKHGSETKKQKVPCASAPFNVHTSMKATMTRNVSSQKISSANAPFSAHANIQATMTRNIESSYTAPRHASYHESRIHHQRLILERNPFYNHHNMLMELHHSTAPPQTRWNFHPAYNPNYSMDVTGVAHHHALNMEHTFCHPWASATPNVGPRTARQQWRQSDYDPGPPLPPGMQFHRYRRPWHLLKAVLVLWKVKVACSDDWCIDSSILTWLKVHIYKQEYKFHFDGSYSTTIQFEDSRKISMFTKVCLKSWSAHEHLCWISSSSKIMCQYFPLRRRKKQHLDFNWRTAEVYHLLYPKAKNKKTVCLFWWLRWMVCLKCNFSYLVKSGIASNYIKILLAVIGNQIDEVGNKTNRKKQSLWSQLQNVAIQATWYMFAPCWYSCQPSLPKGYSETLVV